MGQMKGLVFDCPRRDRRDAVSFLGVHIHRLDLEELIRDVETSVRTKRRTKIMYVNIHVVNLAFKDVALKEALNHAHIVYCDGAGVRIGARILGEFLPQRMTGADWIWDLCAMCEKRRYSIYILGGNPGIAEKAGHILKNRCPGLEIAGVYHGFFEKDSGENERVVSMINKRSPDILLVGFGSPLQERWIHDNFGRLNATVVWAVGALVDFVSGTVPRGPRWMVDHGLEWLYRLMMEPKRMWKRYLVGNFLFLVRILKTRFRLTGKRR